MTNKVVMHNILIKHLLIYFHRIKAYSTNFIIKLIKII